MGATLAPFLLILLKLALTVLPMIFGERKSAKIESQEVYHNATTALQAAVTSDDVSSFTLSFDRINLL